MAALPRIFLRLLNFYPPFLGAGIRVHRLEHGYETRMSLRFYNRNSRPADPAPATSLPPGASLPSSTR